MSRFAGSLLLGAALLPVFSLPVSAQGSSPLPAGKPAPDFKTTTLAGKPLSLKSLRGKVVLLDIWATWCGPCRMAVPMLQSLHKQFASQGLTVVGLSVDDSSTSGQVKPFQQQMKTTYTLAVNPAANQPIAVAYNAQGIPSLYLIDQKGVVRWSQSGFDPSEGAFLAQQIKDLLGKNTSVAKAVKTSRK